MTAHGRWAHVNVCKVYLVEVCLTCCQSPRSPFVVITIYGVVLVRLAHFSFGDWKDIFIAHVIIIIKSEVSTLPIVIIFFRGRVPELFVKSYYVTNCICIPGIPGFFSLLLCSSWWVQIIGCVLACRSYSFVCILNHHIIIIVQTYRNALKL